MIWPDRTPFPGDEIATWTYWNEMDTAERGVPDDYVWERLRNKRNELISACDWRMVTDSPFDTQAWRDYRQALRDLPESTANPRQAEWPVEPRN